MTLEEMLALLPDNVSGLISAADMRAIVTSLYGQNEELAAAVAVSLSGKQNSLVAGANITIDASNPNAPVISATGGGGGGAVSSVNGQTGVVVITLASLGGVATTDSRLSDQRVPTDGSVTSAKIADGAIVDADINAGASIAGSKVAASTESARGAVELATVAEASTGTDTSRAVTPAGLKAVGDTKVPTSLTVNGLPLSSNIVLDAEDVAAVADASDDGVVDHGAFNWADRPTGVTNDGRLHRAIILDAVP